MASRLKAAGPAFAGRLRRWLSRRSGGDDPAGAFSKLDSPWQWDRLANRSGLPRGCNICGWCGLSFTGGPHSEAAGCPECGSIARDRFLFYCFVHRLPEADYRVLETSPRLGSEYRRAMGRWFEYRASDFDQRSHRADLVLDLQDVELDSSSVDVVLTPHVLEHVPDTGRALSEIHRILAPGGSMFLQVPVLQGETARPRVPEFHGDDTPVEWRFGPDLTDRLRRHGFHTRLLCTEELLARVEGGSICWPADTSPEFDVEAILSALKVGDLDPVADAEAAQWLGFEPAYMFLTWEAKKLEDV